MVMSSSKSRDFRVGAVVVLFHPTEKTLKKLLNNLKADSIFTIIIDNTPLNELSWLNVNWFIENKLDVVYKSLGDNYGIAKAQNEGIDLATSEGCDHVIFFDQDSLPPKGMLDKLIFEESLLLAKGVNVGAVGPGFYNENTGALARVIRCGIIFHRSLKIKDNDTYPIEADILIASGSLVRLEVFKKTGIMREDLFIDGVDVEWMLRAGHFGFQHFVVPTVTMSHGLGDTFVKIGKRKIILHSTIRHYYSIRNHCNLILDPMMGRSFRLITLCKVPSYILIYSFYSESPLATFRLLLNACFDGFSGRLGKLNF